MSRATHLLFTPSLFGSLSAEQAEQWASRIFHCGMCSDDETAVYHNIIGQHLHTPAATLRENVPADGEMAEVEAHRYQ